MLSRHNFHLVIHFVIHLAVLLGGHPVFGIFIFSGHRSRAGRFFMRPCNPVEILATFGDRSKPADAQKSRVPMDACGEPLDSFSGCAAKRSGWPGDH